MKRDYYVLQWKKLNSNMSALEEAITALNEAKKRDSNEYKRLAVKIIQIIGHPHLAYLWFAAIRAKVANAIREAWQEVLPDTIKAIPDIFGFVPDVEDEEKFIYLPLYSFALRIPFQLEKPYLSRDDREFYIVENPVKKEWVFKVPYIAPSQWKGALGSAMMRELVTELYAAGDEKVFFQKRLQLYRIFGHEKDGTEKYLNRVLALRRVGPQLQNGSEEREEWRKQFEEELRKVEAEFDATLCKQGYRMDDVEGFQGRTYFFPTFFDKIGLEVINPHDRKSGAGSQPIYFECVPQGTPGTFVLLYVPFNSTEHDDAKRRQEVAEDLVTLARGVCAMLTTYGFGAKTSSGYGVAEDKLANTGMFAIRAALPCITTPAVSRTKPMSKPGLSCYEGKGVQEEGAAQPERESVLQEILPVVKRTFGSLSELQAVVQEVADALRKEEEA